jgi:hypothetical protein
MAANIARYLNPTPGRSASLSNEQLSFAETTKKTRSAAIHFVKELPDGPTETLLSFLSKADMDCLGSVEGSMMEFLHGDGLSSAAFLDQLEWRQQQGIPLTYAEHKRCLSLIRQERNSQYCLIGRNAHRSASEKRLASMIRHIDCRDGNISDYELREIVEVYPNLESLDLTNRSRTHQITDQGMAFIGKLFRLQALNLSGRRNMTDVGLAHISRLPLKSLRLKKCSMQDSNLRSLANLSTTLEYLDLGENRDVTQAGLSAILGPLLTSLDLSQIDVSDASAALVATLPLKELNLSGSSITDPGLAQLKNLSCLTHLNLAGSRNLTDAGCARFFQEATCPLERLVLRFCHPRRFIHSLERFQTLTHLDLQHSGLTDEQLAPLGKLPLLTHLNLVHNNRITPDGLRALRHLPLKSLNLGYCVPLLNDEGMESVALFRQIEDLDLAGSSEITGNGFAALANLPLRSLHLEHCFFRDQDMQTMAEALSVRCLELSPQCITKESAQALTLLPLEHLMIGQGTFSQESYALLRKTIPHAEIRINNRLSR